MDNLENKNQNTEQETSVFKEIGLFFWDLLKIVIIALVIIVPFRLLIAEPFVVSGSSMVPNFYHKDYLIIDRISYKSSQPQRGDVVVLKFPRDDDQFFIKRVIGLPGEKIRLQQGNVFIYNDQHPNGFMLEENYLENMGQTLGSPNFVNLGSSEYYVLGDNRTASSDSRVWGVLPKDNIVGKAWLRVFPVTNFGFFEKPQY